MKDMNNYEKELVYSEYYRDSIISIYKLYRRDKKSGELDKMFPAFYELHVFDEIFSKRDYDSCLETKIIELRKHVDDFYDQIDEVILDSKSSEISSGIHFIKRLYKFIEQNIIVVPYYAEMTIDEINKQKLFILSEKIKESKIFCTHKSE